ncbi:MAG: hypothetical protein ABI398_03145 [Devosia sp.]
MRVPFRVVAISGSLAALVGLAMVSPALFPAAFANEPQSRLLKTAKDIFPSPFDPKKLRKYDVVFDASVSTEVQRTQIVRKIAFGQKSTVLIVTTPSGTYSSDALTSPYVRYPGIDVTPRQAGHDFSFSAFSSRFGTGTSSRISSGSFIYYNSSFTPSRHGRY